MENINSFLNKDNKREVASNLLMDEATSALSNNLKENINNPNIDIVWGSIILGLNTVPSSSIKIDIDCDKSEFESTLNQKLAEKINSIPKLDSSTKIVRLERNLFFGKAEDKDEPADTRKTVGGGKQVII